MRSLPRIEVVSALLRVSTDVWRWAEQRKGTQSHKCLRFRRAKAVWGSSQFFRMFARANYRGQQILAGTSEFAETNKFMDGPLPQLRNSRCGCGMYLLRAPLARYTKAHLQDLLPTHSHSAFPSKLFHIQHATLSSLNSANECDMLKWRWWKTLGSSAHWSECREQELHTRKGSRELQRAVHALSLLHLQRASRGWKCSWKHCLKIPLLQIQDAFKNQTQYCWNFQCKSTCIFQQPEKMGVTIPINDAEFDICFYFGNKRKRIPSIFKRLWSHLEYLIK